MQSHSPTDSDARTPEKGLDELLLTPDHPPAPVPAPAAQPAIYSPVPQHASGPADELPPGFVPLSPIPSLTNFAAGFGADEPGGHRVFAAPAVVPEVYVPFGSAGTMGGFASSLLFGAGE